MSTRTQTVIRALMLLAASVLASCGGPPALTPTALQAAPAPAATLTRAEEIAREFIQSGG
jgi:hypothetical protein